MPEWQDYNNPKYPNTVSGSLRLLPELYSPQLGNARSLLVYLPRSYHSNAEKRYPVIYMQDGENLFDEQLAFGEEWHVDETLQQLAKEGYEQLLREFPPNNDDRFDEYSPFVDPEYGGGKGNEYLSFIVETIKPIIDTDFRTQPDRETTGILGSSMGALISLYGFFHFSEIFGFAGALSPAIWFSDNAFISYLQDVKQPPKGKLYLDTGHQELSEGENTDKSEQYVNLVRQLRDILMTKGYSVGHDLMYVEDKIGIYNEQDWARRLPDALRFLFPVI